MGSSYTSTPNCRTSRVRFKKHEKLPISIRPGCWKLDVLLLKFTSNVCDGFLVETKTLVLRVFWASLKMPIVFGQGNLQQFEKEKHRYKTYFQRWAQEVKERKLWESATNGGGKKILQGLRGFRYSRRGSSTTFRDTTTTLSEKLRPTQILQCFLMDCARWM